MNLPSSRPDDMQTTAWMPDHRDQLIALHDSVEDMMSASQAFGFAAMGLAVDTLTNESGTPDSTPIWLLYAIKEVSALMPQLAAACGTLILLSKGAQALNQPIDSDQPT